MKRVFQSDSAKTVLSCAVLAFLTLLLYKNCLKYYFSMEDFLCIEWVEREGGVGVLQSFYTDNEYGVYRPIGIHVYYYLCRLLFDLDPFGYHLVSLISHTLNVLLVFMLVLILTGNRWASFLAGATYMSRISHYIGVFWVSAISEVWLALFYLISIAAFALYSQRKKPYYWLVSLGSFAVALGCKENAITLPFALLSFEYLLNADFRLKRAAKRIGPFFVVLLSYLVLKLIILKPMIGSLYEIGVGMWLFRNLLLYTIWQINLSHLAVICLNFFTEMRPYSLLADSSILWSGLTTVIFICLGLMYLFRRKLIHGLRSLKMDSSNRLALFGITAFLIGVSPALLLSSRVQEYYLFVPSIGFSLCVAGIWGKRMSKALLAALLVIMISSNVVGLALLEKTPDGRTSTVAKGFLEDLNQIINAKVDDNVTTVYIYNANTFLYQVLWYGEAYNTFLDNPVPIIFDIHQLRPPSGEGVLKVHFDGQHLREIEEP